MSDNKCPDCKDGMAGIGDFHDKDEISTLHFCETCKGTGEIMSESYESLESKCMMQEQEIKELRQQLADQDMKHATEAAGWADKQGEMEEELETAKEKSEAWDYYMHKDSDFELGEHTDGGWIISNGTHKLRAETPEQAVLALKQKLEPEDENA